LIIVDGGSLIFPDDKANEGYLAKFHARYIFLNRGALMEVGTEDDPYNSRLEITMYGERYDPYVPKFGNKCIAVHYSRLEIHGKPRTPTWTSLEVTAKAGENFIRVKEDVDWKAGEEIVIANTELGIEDNEVAGQGDRSEQVKIASVNGR
jgi:hypothetical protein